MFWAFLDLITSQKERNPEILNTKGIPRGFPALAWVQQARTWNLCCAPAFGEWHRTVLCGHRWRAPLDFPPESAVKRRQYRWSSLSRNQTRVSCIAGRLFTIWAIMFPLKSGLPVLLHFPFLLTLSQDVLQESAASFLASFTITSHQTVPSTYTCYSFLQF